MHRIFLQTSITWANTGLTNMAKIRTNKQEVWKWYNLKKNSWWKLRMERKNEHKTSTHNLHYTTGHYRRWKWIPNSLIWDTVLPWCVLMGYVQYKIPHTILLLQVNNQFHIPWLKYAALLLLKQSSFACQLVSPQLPAFMRT